MTIGGTGPRRSCSQDSPDDVNSEPDPVGRGFPPAVAKKRLGHAGEGNRHGGGDTPRRRRGGRVLALAYDYGAVLALGVLVSNQYR